MAAAKEDIEAVKEWLATEVRLDRYADKLESNGFTSLELCCTINENALDEMQIVLPYHRRRFLKFVEELRTKLDINMDLTIGEDGVISNTELTSHSSETGNEQQGPLINFDSEDHCSFSSVPSEDINSEDVNVPILPPKKKQQSVKLPPPPIPRRLDLEGEPSDQKSTAVDAHAGDLKQVSIPEKPAVQPQQHQQQQPEVPPKKAPVKPPRRTTPRKQSSENAPEDIPKTNIQTGIQEQHAISTSHDNAATVNPSEERDALVQVNSMSVVPELPKPEEDTNKIISGEEVNEERPIPPIEPKRPAPKAPDRAPSLTRPIPKPRSRVKTEDSVLVSDLLPKNSTAGDSKGDLSTRINNTFEKRTQSFSTPGNRRFDPSDEKPSTMPRAATVKRPPPPLPPSRQNGSSVRAPIKQGVPLPVVPFMGNTPSQPSYELVGAFQQGNLF